MSLTIPAALQTIAAAGRAVGALRLWGRKLRGDQRALVMELTDNLKLLDLVADEGVPLGEVVDKLSTAEYERLAKSGFDFDKLRGVNTHGVNTPKGVKALKPERIRHFPSLDGTDLRHWPGKTTGELVESIYGKLRDLKLRYPLQRRDGNQRWGVRVNNIRKRIWLLLRHVG